MLVEQSVAKDFRVRLLQKKVESMQSVIIQVNRRAQGKDRSLSNICEEKDEWSKGSRRAIRRRRHHWLCRRCRDKLMLMLTMV